jgi:hypothetical protein
MICRLCRASAFYLLVSVGTVSFADSAAAMMASLDRVGTVSRSSHIIQIQESDQKDRQIADLYAEIQLLQAENRKLALALADAMGNLTQAEQSKVQEPHDGGSPENQSDIAALREQNLSLRETIKAQNEVLASSDNAAGLIQELKKENVKLRGLKETIKQLQAQNEHLSVAGNLGKTVTNQIVATQQKNTDLEKVLAKEREISAAYKEKVKEYELEILELRKKNAKYAGADSVVSKDQVAAYEDEILSLKLENQDLKAQLKLLEQQKTAQVGANAILDDGVVLPPEKKEKKPFAIEITPNDLLRPPPAASKP